MWWIIPLMMAGGAGLYQGSVYAQRQVIYGPDPKLIEAETALPPARTFKDLKTEDGQTLVAWFAEPKDAEHPLVLYFHGRDGTLDVRRLQFRSMIEHGYGLLALAFRGFNGSSGSPTEAGLMQDAEAAYAKARDLGYEPGRIVLMGESLGTGVATMLAARRDVAAVVLDSPYLSMIDLSARHAPWYPAGIALVDTFRADEAIGKVKAPILMVSGRQDRMTPTDGAETLSRITHPPKCLTPVTNSNHITFSHPDVLRKAMEWIDQTLSERAAAACPEEFIAQE